MAFTENISNLILDILYLTYLSLSGDVKPSVKFIYLEFREEMCAIDINLGVIDIFIEFRTMGLDEITKYTTEIEKTKCLRTEPWEFTF